MSKACSAWRNVKDSAQESGPDGLVGGRVRCGRGQQKASPTEEEKAKACADRAAKMRDGKLAAAAARQAAQDAAASSAACAAMPDAQGVHGPKVPASPQPLQLPVQEKEAEQEDEAAAEAFWMSLAKDSQDVERDDGFQSALAKELGLD